MPSQGAGRCLEGEKERKLKIHTAEVCASMDARRYSRKQRGINGKRDGGLCSPWLLLLLISRSSQAEIEPIVRNDTIHTRGHIEKFSLPAAAELGLPTTVCTVTT